MELIIDHAYMVEASKKLPIVWSSEIFQVGEHIHIPERVMHPNSMGT